MPETITNTLKPNIDPSVFLAEGAVVTGNVTIGKEASVWMNAVIRGDMDKIIIGDETNVQDNATLHVGYGFPMTIGNRVTIGHNAVVHGCTVGDETLIGMGSVILNGAKIGKHCVIGAGAVVTEGAEIPDGSIVLGVPGKIVREANGKDIAHNQKNAAEYAALANEYKRGKFADGSAYDETLERPGGQ